MTNQVNISLRVIESFEATNCKAKRKINETKSNSKNYGATANIVKYAPPFGHQNHSNDFFFSCENRAPSPLDHTPASSSDPSSLPSDLSTYDSTPPFSPSTFSRGTLNASFGSPPYLSLAHFEALLHILRSLQARGFS